MEMTPSYVHNLCDNVDTAEKRLRMRETRGKLTIKSIRTSVHGLETQETKHQELLEEDLNSYSMLGNDVKRDIAT